jgi:hypothetical protein
MSLNACALDTNTVDLLCGYRRSQIVSGLLREKYPAVGTRAGGSGGRSHWTPRAKVDEEFQAPGEQSVVTISLSLDGVTYTTSQVRTNEHALVMIGNMEITEDQVISVNISGLTLT